MNATSVAGERLHRIILAPVVSEKSTRLGDKHGQVVFRVLRDAHKDEIRRAVELLFKVKVENVQTLIVYGKSRRTGRVLGRRKDWKKAYVRLAQGQKIDFGAGAAG